MAGRLRFHLSKELTAAIPKLVRALGLSYIDPSRVYVAFSVGSRSTAYARIWGVPRPFVELGVCKPAYVIELVSENLARVSDCEEILCILVHELLHIPRTFSGGLRSHGEWARRSNIRRFVSRIPADLAGEICRLVRDGVERLVSRGHG